MSRETSNGLTKYTDVVVMGVVKHLSLRYGFDVEEAMSECGFTTRMKTDPPRMKTRRESPECIKTRLAANVVLPFCGSSIPGWCAGVRPTGGLYTQCVNGPESDSPYCKTCLKQANTNGTGKPNGGDIGDRVALGQDWVDPKGKKPVNLAKYMKSKGVEITDKKKEEIQKAAALLGQTIAESEWDMGPVTRGRPRKPKTAVVDTTATDSDGETPELVVPRMPKFRKNSSSPTSLGETDLSEMVLSSPGESSMMTRRNSPETMRKTSSPKPLPPPWNNSDPVVSPLGSDSGSMISPITSNADEKMVSPKDEKALPVSKEAEKASKDAAKKADKAEKAAAKKAEKDAAKEAAKAEKDVAKAEKAAAKKAEKDAAKKAKDAAKKAKDAAKAEKDAAKKAKDAAKAEKDALIGTVAIEEGIASDVPMSATHESDVLNQCCAIENVISPTGERCTESTYNDGKMCEKHTYEGETDDEDDEAAADDDEEGDDDEDEASGVEEFEWNGAKYLKDPETNEVFDYDIFMETGDAQEVGTWVEDTGEIDFLSEDD